MVDSMRDAAMRRHRSGRPYRRAKSQMHDNYGYLCHLCGHGGAIEADHLTPVAIDPHQPLSPHLMRPAHGNNAPCPTCGRKCNAERGTKPIEAVYRPPMPL